MIASTRRDMISSADNRGQCPDPPNQIQMLYRSYTTLRNNLNVVEGVVMSERCQYDTLHPVGHGSNWIVQDVG